MLLSSLSSLPKLIHSPQLRKNFTLTISVLMLILVTLGVQVRWIPKYHDIDIDSGVYSYAGTRILKGELPYRDFWDHKPPGVHYLNALAFRLLGITPWALWWLGLVWITTIVVVLFLVLYKLVGWSPALIATIFFLLTLHHPLVYKGGNYPETYALLPQLLIILCTLFFFTSRNNRWIFFIGIFSALAFLLKQTTIAIGIASICVILYKDLQARSFFASFQRVLLFITGGLIPILIVIRHWWAQGALTELWEAVIEYNLLYSKGGFTIRSIYASIRELAIPQPFATLFALSIVSTIVFFVKNNPRLANRITDATDLREEAIISNSDDDRDWRKCLFTTVVVAIPLEVLMISFSGRTFGHYFITPLPVLVFAIAYLLHSVGMDLRRWSLNEYRMITIVSLIAVLIIPWFLEIYGRALPSKNQLLEVGSIFSMDNYLTDEVNDYIKEISNPDQSILVWGNSAQIYFYSDRRASSRYFYNYPLLTPGYDNQKRFEEFMTDLQSDPPALVAMQRYSEFVYTYDRDDKQVCPDCPSEIRAGVLKFRDYVKRNYSNAQELRDWVVYIPLD